MCFAGGNVGIGSEAPVFKLQVNGSAAKTGGGSWSVSSDRRLKKNIENLDGDAEAINELEGERLGFIAQEVETVIPDWVEEVGGYKRLTIRGFEALAVEALRELEARNAELEAQVAELRAAFGVLAR